MAGLPVFGPLSAEWFFRSHDYMAMAWDADNTGRCRKEGWSHHPVRSVEQALVPALIRGRLEGFSSDRLFRFLNALDQDIEIVRRCGPHGAVALSSRLWCHFQIAK